MSLKDILRINGKQTEREIDHANKSKEHYDDYDGMVLILGHEYSKVQAQEPKPLEIWLNSAKTFAQSERQNMCDEVRPIRTKKICENCIDK